jgi:hypothetical protein
MPEKIERLTPHNILEGKKKNKVRRALPVLWGTGGKRSGPRRLANVPTALHWILPQILFPALDSSCT